MAIILIIETDLKHLLHCVCMWVCVYVCRYVCMYYVWGYTYGDLYMWESFLFFYSVSSCNQTQVIKPRGEHLTAKLALTVTATKNQKPMISEVCVPCFIKFNWNDIISGHFTSLIEWETNGGWVSSQWFLLTWVMAVSYLPLSVTVFHLRLV